MPSGWIGGVTHDIAPVVVVFVTLTSGVLVVLRRSGGGGYLFYAWWRALGTICRGRMAIASVAVLFRRF